MAGVLIALLLSFQMQRFDPVSAESRLPMQLRRQKHAINTCHGLGSHFFSPCHSDREAVGFLIFIGETDSSIPHHLSFMWRRQAQLGCK